MVDDRVHRAGQPGHGEQPERHHDVADLADDVEGEDPLEVLLGDGAEDADDHRQPGEDEDQGLGPAVGGEQQRLGADDRVDADLGQQAGEDGGHRGRRGRVAVGQPEVEREQRRLDAEHDEQQGGERRPRTPVGQLGGCARRGRPG